MPGVCFAQDFPECPGIFDAAFSAAQGLVGADDNRFVAGGQFAFKPVQLIAGEIGQILGAEVNTPVIVP